MKKTFSFLLPVALLLTASVNAQQPMPANNKDGLNGKLVLHDNSVITGVVKDNIRKKGEVVLLRDGKKTKYAASEVASVQIGEAQFITGNGTFYEVIWEGKTLSLVRKASEPSGLQYNGTEPMVISSEGNIGDFLVKKTGEPTLYLLTKKNQQEVLGKLCGTCAAGIDETKFDAESVRKIVERCDQCK